MTKTILNHIELRIALSRALLRERPPDSIIALALLEQ